MNHNMQTFYQKKMNELKQVRIIPLSCSLEPHVTEDLNTKHRNQSNQSIFYTQVSCVSYVRHWHMCTLATPRIKMPTHVTTCNSSHIAFHLTFSNDVSYGCISLTSK